LSSIEIEKVKIILKEISNPISIKVLKDSSPFSEKLIDYMKSISDLNENINIEISVTGAEPSISVTPNLRYHALPDETELEPFLKTLVRISKQNSELPDDIKERIKEIQHAELMVFIMPVCPHCAKIVERLNQFAIENSMIGVQVFDVAVFPEMVNEFEIMSAPTVVINGKIKLVNPSEDELIEFIESDKESEYFIRLLKDGQIDELRAYLEKNPEETASLVDLLRKSELSVRLGAIISILKMTEKKPELLGDIKNRLKGLLREDNSNIVQDAAFVLGKIGDEVDIGELEKLFVNENKDVREAAQEAIDEITSRNEE